MAWTHIHQIKTTLNKALAYIENPEKTDELLLVSSYNCDSIMASVDFEMTAALAKEIKGDYSATGGSNILAFHMIQSFNKYDKLTHKQAHEVGKKWVDEILQGKYEYVISTHVDKGHIHNHVIFNATSFYDYKKYETVPYKTAKLLREKSDRICEERGLHVIKNPKFREKSPSQYEMQHRISGTSWKEKIQKAIDSAINKTNDYQSFKAALEKDGIEILEGARITFHVIGVESKNGRAAKCRGDRIGEDYTKERIIERLAEPKIKQRQKMVPPDEAKSEKPTPKTTKEPVFSSYDKKVEWQARQSRLAGTKELAAALLTIRQETVNEYGDFSKRLSDLQDKNSEVKGTMKKLDGKNQQYKAAAKYLVAYNQYLPVYQKFKQQSILSRKGYEKKHEGELAAFSHATKQLESLGVNVNVDSNKVITLIKEQDGKVKELTATMQQIDNRIRKLRAAQDIVDHIQGGEQEQERTKKQHHEI